MKKFRIKEPGQRNITRVVNAYNAMNGLGVEVFFDMKRGKVFVADYFRNFNHKQFSKITCSSEDAHLSEISVAYVCQEIERIKQKMISNRKTEEMNIKDRREFINEQRSKRFLKIFHIKSK